MQCPDCGESWTFGEGEAEWYAANGLQMPRRCRPCRVRRRDYRNREGRQVGAISGVSVAKSCGFLVAVDGQEFFFRLTDAPADVPLSPGELVTFAVGDKADGPRQRACLIKRSTEDTR